ncbi:MAG: asparagine synthase-related protein [Chloroflexota bacterium]
MVSPTDISQAASGLRGLLEDAVRANVAEGTLLSGGLACDLERDLSARVFRAYDLRYPYMLAGAVGLALSAPYLSLEVARYARQLPVDLKVTRYGNRVWGKWLLRKAFEDCLPAEVVWRRKTTIDQGCGALQALEAGRSLPEQE